MPKAPISKSETSQKPPPKKLVGKASAPGQSSSGKKSEKSVSKPKARDVVWPDIKVQLSVGENAITYDKAWKLLGCQAESENIPLKEDHHFRLGAKVPTEKDGEEEGGKRVRCNNNISNRPIYRAVVETLKQEILRGRWRFNGEPIIVGRTGLILNGQHTLIALLLAVEDWRNAKAKLDDRYDEVWPEEPTLEKLVVVGVDESDETVNTMDTCKPRSLADVFFRSTHFAKYNGADRKALSRMADYAIRLLWERTGRSGGDFDAYAPRRTHAESIAFWLAHPKLQDCVIDIKEQEGTDGRLSKFVPLGAAAGLMYLMGCCESVYDEKDADNHLIGYLHDPREAVLVWTYWKKAQEFWATLAGGRDELAQVVRKAYSKIDEIGVDEKIAILIKAWNCFANDDEVTEELLELEYKKNSDGFSVLADHPTINGIDIGSPE